MKLVNHLFPVFCIFFLLVPSAAHAKNCIIFDGDSLVAGYPANAPAVGISWSFPHGTDFPSQVMKALGPSWSGFSVAMSSRELSAGPGDDHRAPGRGQLEDFDQAVLPIIQSAHDNGADKIIVVNGGEPSNMLYYGTGGPAAQAAAYKALQSYAEKVHKAGALFVNITMPARTPAGGSDKTLSVDIEAVNLLMKRSCRKDHICDVLVPLDMDARMKDISDTRYYIDGTHFNAAGYRVWAEYALKGIKKAISLK